MCVCEASTLDCLCSLSLIFYVHVLCVSRSDITCVPVVTLRVSIGKYQSGTFVVKLDGGDASMKKNRPATTHELNHTSHVQSDTLYLNECIPHGTVIIECHFSIPLWQSLGANVPQP